MDQNSQTSPTRSSSGSLPRIVWVLLLASVIALGAAYMGSRKSQSQERLNALAVGEMAQFDIFDSPRDVSLTPFHDRDGNEVRLTDFEGQVVLANFWATWCAPCVAEMPSLDGLAAKISDDRIRVITISIDRQGYGVMDPFFDRIGIKNLPSYLDRSNKLTLEMQANVLPTTVLIGADGKFLGRLVGPAKWDSEDAVKLLRAAAGE